MSAAEIEIQLARIEVELEALDAERADCAQRAPDPAGARADDPDGPVARDAREAALLGDPEYQRALQAAIASGASGAILARATDPAERRLDIHRRMLLRSLVRLDPAVAPRTRELTARIEAFPLSVNGVPAGRLDRVEALRHEPDRDAREAAWFALTPLAELLESGLVRLFEERNRAAGLFGYERFPDLAFEASELSRLEFMATCDELEQLTRPIYEQFLSWCRSSLDAGALEPWDLDYLLARLEEPPERRPRKRVADDARRLLAEQGFPSAEVRVESAPEASPWSTRVLASRAPQDVLLLVNPRDGRAWLDPILAGFGRALRRIHLPAGVDAAGWRRDAAIVEEIAAGVAERRGLATMDAPEDARGAAWRRWRDVLGLRRAIAMALFEILAYEHIEGDLHGLWSEIHEQYLGYPRHPERLWGANAGLTTRPLRVATAIMGRLAADQLVTALTARHGGDCWTAAAFGELRDGLWLPGARIPWETRLERLTGRLLDPEATLRRLGADPDA